MVRIPLFEDYALLLSPRADGLGPGWQAGLLAALGLAPALLVLWLYRSELRLVGRLTALALLALRLAVIALLWLLVALQPVVARSITEELPGRVLVVVDRSASMDVADPQRSVLDKLRLARALKVRTADGQPPADLLDAWIHHYEQKRAGGPPPWVAEDEPALADRRKAWHDALCRHVDQLTRADVARLVLAAKGGGLLPALRARYTVELAGFHEDCWDVNTDRPDDVFRQGPVERKGTRPGTYLGPGCTDLAQPLARALERSGPERGRLLGVVLLTDGQHNHGPSPVPKAAALGGRKVPVFPVALGARRPPPDIVLTEVRAPTNVFRDMQAPVEARFQVRGLPAQDIKVELHRQGRPLRPEDVQTVRHDGTGRPYVAQFQPVMTEAGTHALTVKVRATNERTREATTLNNDRTVIVRVASDRVRVLLVDGEARWEYHYLAGALRRDPAVAADTVVFRQPRVGQVSEAELAKEGNPRLRLPAQGKLDREDPLARYDCIVLGDVAPDGLPPADRRRLERYVADRGGTLVFVAGKRHMPLGFLAERGPDAEADPLRKLLPVEAAQPVRPAAGFPITLTDEGRTTPFLQLEADPQAGARLWAELPRHYWGVVGRAKPGAAVLAFVPGDEARQAKGGAERDRALIARQNYGFGRVLYVGLDSTWRWRYKVGDLYHHRFWGQVVRWAAADGLLPAGNRYVRFGTRDPVYRRGQAADVLVRLAGEVEPLPPGARANARIMRRGPGGKDEAVAVVRLTPAPARPRVLQGQVRDLPPGRYGIELDIPRLGDKLKADPGDKGPGRQGADFRVLAAESGELADVAANWTLLEALAAAGGGELFTPETAGRLPDRLSRQVVRREQRDEQRLWQDAPLVWWVLGLFVVLLTLEWAGRKLAGLP
jgi:hypothetical protein